MPIHYMHKSVPFEELTAMYALADACLVTSTRDGMNLVSTGRRCEEFLPEKRQEVP
jgi:trehalose-6-phosphate synthase